MYESEFITNINGKEGRQSRSCEAPHAGHSVSVPDSLVGEPLPWPPRPASRLEPRRLRWRSGCSWAVPRRLHNCFCLLGPRSHRAFKQGNALISAKAPGCTTFRSQRPWCPGCWWGPDRAWRCRRLSANPLGRFECSYKACVFIRCCDLRYTNPFKKHK